MAADKARPNKTSETCSGVGSNMPTDDSTCQAIQSISKQNYPCTPTDSQKAIRGLSEAKVKNLPSGSGVL